MAIARRQRAHRAGKAEPVPEAWLTRRDELQVVYDEARQAAVTALAEG
jgi:hypothetical protein